MACRDMGNFIRLIDDPTHTVNEDGTYHLSEIQAPGPFFW